jgi:lysophospholipase L1-like esterase
MTAPLDPRSDRAAEPAVQPKSAVGHAAAAAAPPGGASGTESDASTSAGVRRLVQVILGLTAFIASTYLIPPLHSLQPWKRGDAYVPYWNVVGRELLGEGERMARQQEEFERWKQANMATAAPSAEPVRPPPPAPAAATFPAYVPTADDAAPPKTPLENAKALEHYYRRLALAELGVRGAVARASHFGDSLLGNDVLPMAIRARLQARFGDAGYGFHYLAPKSNFNQRLGIRFSHLGAWNLCEVNFKCEADGRYGLAGVSARSTGGAHSRFQTATEGVGAKASRFELWYEKSPGGGVFEVDIDGEAKHEVPTDAPSVSDDVAVFALADGAHRIDVRALARRGPVRGYGVVLERDGPGVVWENLSLIGTYAMSLHNHDAEHVAWHVRRRQSDLLVLSLSGNDAQRSVADIRANFETEYLRTLRNLRAGRPEASCLVLGVTAHGKRTQNDEIVDVAAVAEMITVQRKISLAEGCGFIDLYQAMGGNGSVSKWFHSSPRLMDVDLGHPTGVGRELLATFVYRALMHGYGEYRTRIAGEPVAELAAPVPAGQPAGG